MPATEPTYEPTTKATLPHCNKCDGGILRANKGRIRCDGCGNRVELSVRERSLLGELYFEQEAARPDYALFTPRSSAEMTSVRALQRKGCTARHDYEQWRITSLGFEVASGEEAKR